MVGAVDGDTIGVAPGAEWISAGVIDQPGRSLSMTISDIIEAFQWALDPDGDPTTTDDVPDVILNSWGIPKGLFQPCDDTFYDVVDAVEAAGIVTIFACGNEGPDPMSLRLPADRASTPLNSFTVGAVDGNYQVTRVLLRPNIVVKTAEMVETAIRTVESAHDKCIISNSCNTKVVVEPTVTCV